MRGASGMKREVHEAEPLGDGLARVVHGGT